MYCSECFAPTNEEILRLLGKEEYTVESIEDWDSESPQQQEAINDPDDYE